MICVQALDALQQAVNIRCRAIDRIADAGGRAHSINSLTAGTVLERRVMRQPVHKQAGMARLTEPSHGTSRGPAQPAQVAPATAAGDQQPQGPQVPPSAACCPLQPTAPVLVLFSGGVDSTLLAACAHRALPAGAPIDLASVCFDDGCSPDRQALHRQTGSQSPASCSAWAASLHVLCWRVLTQKPGPTPRGGGMVALCTLRLLGVTMQAASPCR